MSLLAFSSAYQNHVTLSIFEPCVAEYVTLLTLPMFQEQEATTVKDDRVNQRARDYNKRRIEALEKHLARNFGRRTLGSTGVAMS